MKVLYRFTKPCLRYLTSRSFASHSFQLSEKKSSFSKLMHCYKTLFPWENAEEFSHYLTSCIVYNDGGLLVLNKPYGIKIHGHDKPGARPKSDHQFMKPSVPECNYTVEDCLPAIQAHFKLPKLSIIKSAEKYTSGVVLLSADDTVTEKITKSFNIAKFQKKPHLVHWAVTVGYPVVPYRKEKVGISFLETEENKIKQPIIRTEMSKRDCKLKRVYSVNVESRAISVNKNLSTSLVEIASSSVRWHFVRLYASSRVAPILGDILYGSRMKTFLGVPVNQRIQTAYENSYEPLPCKITEALNLPKGTIGEIMIPTMLHLRSIILPSYIKKDSDFSVVAEMPPHFQWTVNKLNLLLDCK